MGPGLGTVLGALNVLVIAIAFALGESEPGLAVIVMMFGLAPGVMTGAALGWIAQRMQHVVPVVRLIAIAIPAIGVVIALGLFFEQGMLIAYSSIPTLAIASILERSTRVKLSPPIPTAQTR